MPGFLNFLGNAAAPAAGALAARNNAQASASQQKAQLALQAIAMQRQAELDRQQEVLRQADVRYKNAQADELNARLHQPKIPQHVFDQDGNPYIIDERGVFHRASIASDEPEAAGNNEGPVKQPKLSATPEENTEVMRESMGLRPTQSGSLQSVSPSTPAPGPTPTSTPTPTRTMGASSPKFGPRGPNPATIPGTPENLAAVEAQARIKSKFRPEPSDHFTTYQDTDPQTGKPRTMRLNTVTGETQEVGGGKTGTGAGGGGQGQVMQARLLGSVSEGRLADERMTKFEDSHLKNGKLQVGVIPDVAAGLSTGLAGTHSITGILAQKVGERAANATDPAYSQYLRDARLIARAEQLMSARGGSEAQASDNAFLARGGAGAPQATVDAARKSRRALFGKLGAVMQTLTPQQAEKLNQGLSALQNDEDLDYGKLGKEIFGPAGIVVPQSGNITLPDNKDGRSTGSTTPTREQALWDAAVAKHGRAKVEQTYGPRP